MPDRTDKELLPFDPEIERTFRLRRSANRLQEKVEMVEQNAIREYALPSTLGVSSAIRQPGIATNNFEIKPAMLQMMQTQFSFKGLPDDDPNEHIATFLEVCDTFKFNGVPDESISMRLFPFSLKDRAREWLQNSITTWEELATKFLARILNESGF